MVVHTVRVRSVAAPIRIEHRLGARDVVVTVMVMEELTGTFEPVLVSHEVIDADTVAIHIRETVPLKVIITDGSSAFTWVGGP